MFHSADRFHPLRPLLITVFAVVLALVSSPPATAAVGDISPGERPPTADHAEPQPKVQWHLSLGAFLVFGSETDTEAGIQARWAPRTIAGFSLRPIAGASYTSDENYWVYAGAGWEIPFAKRWIAMPSFAIAAYEDGPGRRLGSTLEFRTGLAIERELPLGGRIGVSLYHLSNAGLGSFNPGSESLVFTWSPRALSPH